MISALFKLVPWYWRWLAFIALILAAMAYGAAKMHGHDVLKLDALEADVAKAQAVAQALEADHAAKSKQLTLEKDNDRELELATSDAYWSAYIDRMRTSPAGGDAVPQPVREPPTVCDDAARDQRLSAALAVYRSEIRGAIAEHRAGIGRLLERGHLQTADLICVQDWAKREQAINATAGK
jgi:hypothetical protein